MIRNVSAAKKNASLFDLHRASVVELHLQIGGSTGPRLDEESLVQELDAVPVDAAKRPVERIGKRRTRRVHKAAGIPEELHMARLPLHGCCVDQNKISNGNVRGEREIRSDRQASRSSRTLQFSPGPNQISGNYERIIGGQL